MVHCAQMVAVIKMNGQVMREVRQNDSDVIYLPFGSEYEVCLNNLSPYRAAVSVEVDGKDALSDRRLVIDSNSEGILKGFMESDGLTVKNRFKFIQMTDQIAAHRGTDARDGLIRIEYQFEKPYNPPQYDYHRYDNPYYGALRSSVRSKGVSGQSFGCSDSGLIGTSEAQSFNACNVPLSNTDKGITVAGSIVNQNFNTTYLRELFSEKHVVVFELRGQLSDGVAVAVPRTVRAKIECPTCGIHNHSRDKFCGNCGTCLI